MPTASEPLAVDLRHVTKTYGRRVCALAGIFPDLITNGTIDLVLSKPISRLRLFLTQYAAGLLFVTLQVTIFTLASFLVIGLRGGVWEPGLFITVPLVLCFFSYLFAVCVLLGMLTRSTVAALLLTLLFWFFVYGVGVAEHTLLMFRTMEEQGVTMLELQSPPRAKVRWEDGAAEAKPKPSPETAETAPDQTDAEEQATSSLAVAHNILYGLKTLLPKTSETMGLLDRTLISMADLSQASARRQNKRAEAVGQKLQEKLRSRSVGWIVGTSLLFEAAVLALAAWIFCRRDF